MCEYIVYTSELLIFFESRWVECTESIDFSGFVSDLMGWIGVIVYDRLWLVFECKWINSVKILYLIGFEWCDDYIIVKNVGNFIARWEMKIVQECWIYKGLPRNVFRVKIEWIGGIFDKWENMGITESMKLIVVCG